MNIRRRPYRVEYTGSLSTSEVKRRRARLVLGWGTAWEHLRVLSAFIAATDICSFNESGYMFDDFARDKGPIDSSRSGAIGPRRLAPIGSSRSDPIPKLVSNVT